MNMLDPRIQKTKSAIKDAFLDLVCKYDDYLKISIKELCAKAEVGRKTFYLHYKQIDEVLEEIQDEYIEKFYDQTKDLNFIDDAEKVIGIFFDMNEEKEGFKKISTSIAYIFVNEIAKRKLIKYFESKGKECGVEHHKEATQYFLFHYYNMNVALLYAEWVNKNNPMPKEEMISLIAELVRNGLSNLVKFKQ